MSRSAWEFTRGWAKIWIAEDELNELKQPSVATWLEKLLHQNQTSRLMAGLLLGKEKKIAPKKKKKLIDWLLNG